jgi:hypothetical protein
LVLAATFRTENRFGFPYHLISPSGEIRRSFGDPKVHGLMDLREHSDRLDAPPTRFAVAPDERSIWVSPQFHVRQYSLPTGTTMRQLDVVQSPWLPTPRESTVVARGRTITLHPGMGSVSIAGVDLGGLLWINVSRPGTSALELLDPRSGAILVSWPTRTRVEVVRPGLIATWQQDSDGIVAFTMWRAELRRP